MTTRRRFRGGAFGRQFADEILRLGVPLSASDIHRLSFASEDKVLSAVRHLRPAMNPQLLDSRETWLAAIGRPARRSTPSTRLSPSMGLPGPLACSVTPSHPLMSPNPERACDKALHQTKRGASHV